MTNDSNNASFITSQCLEGDKRTLVLPLLLKSSERFLPLIKESTPVNEFPMQIQQSAGSSSMKKDKLTTTIVWMIGELLE